MVLDVLPAGGFPDALICRTCGGLCHVDLGYSGGEFADWVRSEIKLLHERKNSD